MISRIRSRGLGIFGAFTNCVVGFTIGQTWGTKRNFQNAFESGQFEANFPAGGLKECVKASITGIPPDPLVMEQYIKPEQQMNRQQFQQGVQFHPPQQPIAPQQPPITPPDSPLETAQLPGDKKRYNKYGDEIHDDKS